MESGILEDVSVKIEPHNHYSVLIQEIGLGIDIMYHQYKGQNREIWKKLQELLKDICLDPTKKLQT